MRPFHCLVMITNLTYAHREVISSICFSEMEISSCKIENSLFHIKFNVLQRLRLQWVFEAPSVMPPFIHNLIYQPSLEGIRNRAKHLRKFLPQCNIACFFSFFGWRSDCQKYGKRLNSMSGRYFLAVLLPIPETALFFLSRGPGKFSERSLAAIAVLRGQSIYASSLLPDIMIASP